MGRGCRAAEGASASAVCTGEDEGGVGGVQDKPQEVGDEGSEVEAEEEGSATATDSGETRSIVPCAGVGSALRVIVLGGVGGAPRGVLGFWLVLGGDRTLVGGSCA